MCDIVNGSFEIFGSVFIIISILKLHREKIVRGVSWMHVGFYLMWSYWNLVYYPVMGQWLSLTGGIGIVITNTIWFSQLVYYTRKEKRNGNGT